MQDEERKCLCGATFVIEAGEKRFFENKGFALPKRCVPCRDKKRAEKQKEQSDRDLLA
jgi:hypothetical protein